jgi:hypothetical protein
MNENDWPPDEWPDMSPEVEGKRHFWWEHLTARQQEQVIHRGWTIHWMVASEAINERAEEDTTDA